MAIPTKNSTHYALHNGEIVDSYSEAWRAECEALAVLKMPVPARRGYFGLVRQRRGNDAGQELESAVYRVWIARQAKLLVTMDDRERDTKLMHIERASNLRTRQDVEKAMGRTSANDNQGALI